MTTPPAAPIPATCIKGAPAPWSAVFCALLREAARKGRSQAQIAREYGIQRKEVTRWASKSQTAKESPDRRKPPLWVLRRLASELGYAIVILAERVILVPVTSIPSDP